MEDQTTARLGALAHPTRYAIVRLLLQAGTDGLLPSHMSDQLTIPRNLMSSHLSVLAEAGVVRSIVVGRNRFYTVDTSVLDELGRHLIDLSDGALHVGAVEPNVTGTPAGPAKGG